VLVVVVVAVERKSQAGRHVGRAYRNRQNEIPFLCLLATAKQTKKQRTKRCRKDQQVVEVYRQQFFL
jgi:hypothetical protein